MMKESMRSTKHQLEGGGIGVGTLSVPQYALYAAALIFLVLGFGPNWVFAAASLLAFLIIFALLWRPGDFPTLLYVFLFQWLEATVWIFYTNIHDLPIADDMGASGGRQLATTLILVGLIAQSAGIRLAAGRLSNQYRRSIEIQLLRIPTTRWFRLYAAAVVVAIVARLLASRFPGLSQPLLVVTFFKWSAYVIFTFACFYRPDANRGLWLLVFLFELLFSIGDYFSSFKFVFLFTFFGLAASHVRISIRKTLAISIVFMTAVLFASIWSAIKGEYRHFVSGGEQAQIVTVNFYERLDKVAELIFNLNQYDVLTGFDLLLKRIEYVEYFAEVTDYVPYVIPHSNGDLWLDAVTRPFMPRLFFPEKPIIDESAITIEFSGREVAGLDEGTQISIGYIAETYIDFGKYAMMPILFIWGLFQGWIYRWFLQNESSRGLLGMSLACAIFAMTENSVGNSLTKLVGGFIVCIPVTWLFILYAVPRWLSWRRVFGEVAPFV